MSNTIITSYVWHEGKCFFVSTINRESSAAMAYGRMYAETMAWEYDHDRRQRGDIVGQAEGPEGSIRAHLTMCQRLHEIGCCEASETA